MDIGKVIEFSASDEHRLGVITGSLGKKKLIIKTIDGVEMRTSPKSVSFEVPGKKIDPSVPGEVEKALGKLESALTEAKEMIDLELTWEMVSELGESMSANELADLIFGSEEPAQVLAVMQVLRDDVLYFKSKKEVYEPRPVEIIEQLRSQLEAAQRREQEQRQFLETIAEAQQLPERADRAELIKVRASEDDNLRNKLALLQEYGASDDFFEHKDQANDLLDELNDFPGVKVYGSGSLRAFNLMRELGLWSKHENTWLYRFRINTEVPDHLLEEARALAAKGWEPEPWRKALTKLLCFSIDDASTLDIDDALSCVPREDGGWDLGVHIADPSAFVKAGSELDLAARQRGTSIYLPIGTLPMFPRELSEEAMSLVAGELRPAMTTLVQIDKDLNVVDVEVFASTICVDHRLTYDSVDEVLERDPATPMEVALHDLAFLTNELFHKRQEDGAVSFDIPEAKIVVTGLEGAETADDDDVEPEVKVELLDNESPARLLVAESMIFASANMAKFCARREIPVIYRGQEAPEDELFDEEVMAMPEGLPRFFAMRRKMKPGNITTHPERHFGLGLDMYVQATSPIRRYSDLICQRQVKAFLTDEELPYSPDEILQIAADVEIATREAIKASRGTDQYWAYYYLGQMKGEVMRGTVLNHRDDRIAFVFLHDVALRVKCMMQKRHEPGDEIDVLIERADPRREMLRVKEN